MRTYTKCCMILLFEKVCIVMKKNLISFIVLVILFSSLAPKFVDAQVVSNNTNESLIDFTEIDKQVDNAMTYEIDDKIETNTYIDKSTDTLIVNTQVETGDIEAESEMSLDLENQEIIISTSVEDEETGELVEYDFDVVVTGVDGEEFTAVFTDLKTGEQFNVDTAEVQASWYPLVVIAIHVARHGIKWAIKKHGQKAVKSATTKYGKSASGKTLSKIKFSTTNSFNNHWNKHKREFPGITKDGYLRRAQSLAGSTSKNVLSKKKKEKERKRKMEVEALLNIILILVN